MTDPHDKRPVLIVIVVAVVLRVLFLIAIPLYPDRNILPGYNDEPLHLQYVRHIAEGGGWPTWIDSADSLNFLTDAYIHPPTYYILTAPVYKLFRNFGSSAGLYGARLTSLLFGLIAGIFIYRTAQMWFKDERIAIGALTAGLLAPNSVIFTSIVTNDALLYCLSALAIYSLSMCRLGKGGSIRQILTGAFIAAAVWAKMSGLTLIPLAWFAASPEASTGDRWMARLQVFLVAIMLIMPLLLRNLSNYGQFVPGQSAPLSEEYWPQQAVGVSGGAIHHPIPAVMTFLRLAAVPLMDVWGSILEKSVSLLWILLWGAVFLLGVYKSIRMKPRKNMLLAAIALVAVGFIWHNVKLYQVEFRLFTPAFPALAVVTAMGASQTRLSLILQGLLWIVPLILLPFF